tara:strand:- start:218 stop:634 length:417 start_codon:yes stop_codon:yes gene_type:complete
MAIVVKMPASELPDKKEAADIDTDFFKKNIYDIDSDELKFLGDKPTIVDFHASWCGPCKVLSPIIDKFSEKYKNKVNFYKVNTESEMEVAIAFGIRSVPNLLIIPIEGKPEIYPGAPNESQLEELIKSKLLKDSNDNN